ncbi:MAG: hypothetical protein U5P41_12815 [Gammaproteobacteria bacterium]|nr:hypothetical protein [Gammaproteobacteria bacterium]
MLLGHQYEMLNTILLYYQYSDVDLINIYDHDGYAFARAQPPSIFGDRDKFTNLITNLIDESSKADTIDDGISESGILDFDNQLYFITANIVQSINGPIGVVILGNRI